MEMLHCSSCAIAFVYLSEWWFISSTSFFLLMIPVFFFLSFEPHVCAMDIILKMNDLTVLMATNLQVVWLLLVYQTPTGLHSKYSYKIFNLNWFFFDILRTTCTFNLSSLIWIFKFIHDSLQLHKYSIQYPVY